MEKTKKSITLNTETRKLLEDLAKKMGTTENAVIAFALHQLSIEVK